MPPPVLSTEFNVLIRLGWAQMQPPPPRVPAADHLPPRSRGGGVRPAHAPRPWWRPDRSVITSSCRGPGETPLPQTGRGQGRCVRLTGDDPRGDARIRNRTGRQAPWGHRGPRSSSTYGCVPPLPKLAQLADHPLADRRHIGGNVGIARDRELDKLRLET